MDRNDLEILQENIFAKNLKLFREKQMKNSSVLYTIRN